MPLPLPLPLLLLLLLPLLLLLYLLLLPACLASLNDLLELLDVRRHHHHHMVEGPLGELGSYLCDPNSPQLLVSLLAPAMAVQCKSFPPSPLFLLRHSTDLCMGIRIPVRSNQPLP
eukprot:760902-Hanusia_phi.AAC.1